MSFKKKIFKQEYSEEEFHKGNLGVNMANFKTSINPQEKDLGDGFKVRRSIPQMGIQSVGPFVFWDHMGPAVIKGDQKMKVRAHPHIGLSTITYLLSGEILHRDSLMNEQVIRPGEVNWMTAGSGIVHSERSESKEPMLLEGLQVWLALPREHEDVDPSFVHKKEKDLPVIQGEGWRLRLIAGHFLDEESSLPVYSPLFYLNGWIKDGAGFEHQLLQNEEAALYIINGSLDFDGVKFERFDLVVFETGQKVSFKADKETEFMLFGGESFPEKRKVWWNFVSSDPVKIEEAKKKWKNKEFSDVINETEFIPLPDN